MKSDACRSRWGRRLPFMLLPTPIMVIMMTGMAYTPVAGEWLHSVLGPRSPGLFSCQIAVFGLFWTAYECTAIIVGSLFEALVNDVVPRALVGRFFSLFRMVSLMAGMVFNFFILGHAVAHAREILVGLALFGGLSITAMCLRVREGEYPPPASRRPGRGLGQRLGGVKRYFRECFGHRYYVYFCAAYALGFTAMLPLNSFGIFHARSVGLSDADFGKGIAASYFVSLILAYPLGAAADRVHPVRVGFVTLLIYLGVSFAGFFVATTPGAFLATYMVHTVLGGVFATGTASIAQRMLPADSFAQHFSAAFLVRAAATMAVPPALGWLVELLGRDYRYAFICGTAVTLMALGAFWLLLRHYHRLGGDAAFVLPPK